MVARLANVRFDQVYPDNSGGAVFDTDGDGTATQEDEFVSFTNDGHSAVDVSGWQVWSDSSGSGAPDTAQDGLYHTFPPGTVLQPGETLYIINEVTGPEKSWQQEASEGGQETGRGGVSSNFLTEGNGGQASESVALVDPASGEFIVFNMSPQAETVSSQSGFPGHTKVGEVDGDAVQSDPGAGSSYQYDSGSDTYTYNDVFVPCFTPGTRIDTPSGPALVERLRVGDLIVTRDHGPQPLRGIIARRLDFAAGADPAQKPVEFRPGSLGPDLPRRPLVVSPQHRVLLHDPSGHEVLAPAKALLRRRGVRQMQGRRHVTYLHLVFDRHEIVISEGAPTESFLSGAMARLGKTGPWGKGLHDTIPNDRPLLRVTAAMALA